MKPVLHQMLIGLPGLLCASLSMASGLTPTGEVITSDFDGDGLTEVAQVIRDDPGGSGTFYHLLAVDTDDNGKLRTASAFIGDRVYFLNFWHDRKTGSIAMDLVQAGKGDAACCPTHKVVRRWRMKNGKLAELPARPYGQVSINDLIGQKWRLVQLDGKPLPEEAGIELTFGPGKLGGRSGCNNYTAGVTEPAPGKLQVQPHMAATQMACPEAQMKREQRFLERLGQISAYRWMGKTLALDWSEGEQGGSLVFRAVEE